MELKQIEIFGFKSFADKVVITFSKEEPFVVIVGPNGCGKSNIADAFLWVLGDQSSKSLRLEEKTGVIFSGNLKRKPLNFAEVTLIFIDNENVLPLEYTSVAITRRMYRSGESDYLINRHPVRLKDIYDLLLDSGLGKNSYCIFKQGKMDEIIQFSPIERRDIFMKACGVERFIDKKSEATKKLKESDENILRVQDLLFEIENRIKILNEQVSKVETYEDKKRAYELLAKTIFAFRFYQSLRKIETYLEEKASLQKEMIKREKEKNFLEKEIEEKKQILVTLQTSHQKQKEHLIEKKHQKEFCRKEKEREEEFVKNRKKEKDILQNEQRKSIEENKESDQKKKDYDQKEEKIKNEIEEIEKKRLFYQEKLEKTLEEHTSCRSLLRRKNQEKLDWLKKESFVLNQIEQYEYRKQKEELDWQNLKKNLNYFSETKKEKKQKAFEESDRLTYLLKESETIHKKIENFSSQLANLEEKIFDLLKKQKEKERLKEELLAKENVFSQIQQEGKNHHTSYKIFLQEAKKKESPFYKKIHLVHDLIIPKPGYEKILASLLASYQETVVVEKEQDLIAFLKFCQKENITDFSIISLENISEEGSSSFPSFLEIIEPHPLAFHFLKSIQSVKTLKTGLNIKKQYPKRKLWCEDFELFMDHYGVLTKFKITENNTFIRKAEIQKLQKEREKEEKVLENLQSEIKLLEEKRSEYKKEKQSIQEEYQNKQVEIAKKRTTLFHLEKEREKEENEEKMCEQKLEKITPFLKEVENRIQEFKKEELVIKKQLKGTNKEIEEMEVKEEKLLLLVSTQENEKNYFEKRFQDLLDEKRKTKSVLEKIKFSEDMRKKEQETRQKTIVKIDEEFQKSFENQKQLEKNFMTFSQEEETFSKKIEEINQMLESSQESLKRKQESFKNLQTIYDQIQEKQKNVEVALAEQTILMEEIEKDKVDLFDGSSIKDIKAYYKEIDLNSSLKKLREQKIELNSMNGMNLNAKNEYEELKKRMLFLQEQTQDYHLSKIQFTEIIEQLESESKKKFRMMFAEIRQNFQYNFSLLFGGGEADLILIDEKEILDSGIEIVARPPGKEMRSLSLLSGGEKCLIAIALLLAIFEVKPSPFCLLDEIDAPLDEANVDRFLNLLKKFQGKCQFLLISHNKRTMKMASRIVGVSMEEKGVSKILSMKLSEDKTEPVLV